MTQEPLITETEVVVKLARVLRNMQRFLQETGDQAFCKKNARTGGAGCGQEIYFVKIKGRRTRCVDDEGSTHVCREIKP